MSGNIWHRKHDQGFESRYITVKELRLLKVSNSDSDTPYIKFEDKSSDSKRFNPSNIFALIFTNLLPLKSIDERLSLWFRNTLLGILSSKFIELNDSLRTVFSGRIKLVTLVEGSSKSKLRSAFTLIRLVDSGSIKSLWNEVNLLWEMSSSLTVKLQNPQDLNVMIWLCDRSSLLRRRPLNEFSSINVSRFPSKLRFLSFLRYLNSKEAMASKRLSLKSRSSKFGKLWYIREWSFDSWQPTKKSCRSGRKSLKSSGSISSNGLPLRSRNSSRSSL